MVVVVLEVLSTSSGYIYIGGFGRRFLVNLLIAVSSIGIRNIVGVTRRVKG